MKGLHQAGHMGIDRSCGSRSAQINVHIASRSSRQEKLHTFTCDKHTHGAAAEQMALTTVTQSIHIHWPATFAIITLTPQPKHSSTQPNTFHYLDQRFP